MRRAIAFDQVDPLSTEKGSTLDAWIAGRPKAFRNQRFPVKGWSICGARRAQPVATGGKWNGPENGSNRPIRKPVATHGNGSGAHGK